MRFEDVPHEVNATAGDVVDAAVRVHSLLGPGLLERVYQICLTRELCKRERFVDVEVLAPVVYDGERIDAGYRMDLVVDRQVVVEVKAVECWMYTSRSCGRT